MGLRKLISSDKDFTSTVSEIYDLIKKELSHYKILNANFLQGKGYVEIGNHEEIIVYGPKNFPFLGDELLYIKFTNLKSKNKNGKPYQATIKWSGYASFKWIENTLKETYQNMEFIVQNPNQHQKS